MAEEDEIEDLFQGGEGPEPVRIMKLPQVKRVKGFAHSGGGAAPPADDAPAPSMVREKNATAARNFFGGASCKARPSPFPICNLVYGRPGGLEAIFLPARGTVQPPPGQSDFSPSLRAAVEHSLKPSARRPSPGTWHGQGVDQDLRLRPQHERQRIHGWATPIFWFHTGPPASPASRAPRLATPPPQRRAVRP